MKVTYIVIAAVMFTSVMSLEWVRRGKVDHTKGTYICRAHGMGKSCIGELYSKYCKAACVHRTHMYTDKYDVLFHDGTGVILNAKRPIDTTTTSTSSTTTTTPSIAATTIATMMMLLQ